MGPLVFQAGLCYSPSRPFPYLVPVIPFILSDLFSVRFRFAVAALPPETDHTLLALGRWDYGYCWYLWYSE